jgi:hypothetical protein
MNKRNIVLLLAVSIVMAMGLCNAVLAETFMRQTTHTDAFQMGAQTQPAKDDTASIWIGKDRMCLLQSDGNSVILDNKTQTLYLIDNATKSYAVHDIDQIAKMTQDLLDTSGIANDTSAAAQQKRSAIAMISSTTVDVTPTEETRKIKSWNAKKYVVDISMPIMKTNVAMWTTTDVKVDYDLVQLLNNAFKVEMPGFGVVMDQMKKVKGLPVYTEANVTFMGMNMKATSEVIDVEEKAAPAGIFEIPTDYKKVENLSGGGM